MKLLLIGIDGLRPDCLLHSNSVNIKTLLKKSVYTFDSKISTQTISAPSWSCILSGKKENITKVFSNNDVEKDDFVWKSNNIFKKLNKKNIKNTSVVSDWNGMKNIVQDCNNPIFIKKKSINLSDKLSINETIERYNNTKDNEFIFLYIGSIDTIGHKTGFSIDSNDYINQIEYIDKLLGDLIKKYKNWNIIITTDHGGYNYHDLDTKTKTKFMNVYGKKNNFKDLGFHHIEKNQSKRAFQIYYGKELKQTVCECKEILNTIESKDIYKIIMNLFGLVLNNLKI